MVRVGRIYGVPAKPVAILNFDFWTTSARRLLAPSTCVGVGRMLKRRARTYAVCESEDRRPVGVTYSSLKAWRRALAEVAYAAAPSGSPRMVDIRERRSVTWIRNAFATSIGSVHPFCGASPGALGSSQSPNWKVLDQRPVAGSLGIPEESQDFMLAS